MKKFLLSVLIASSLIAASPKKPKLVLAIVIDQFRYDYLTRYRTEYHFGLDRLLTKGAVFTNARYEHYPTVTAVGHSTILSGATPSISGIIGNEWYDREEGRKVTSVSDSKTQLLGGGGGPGSSPNRMLVDTVGDELKMADGGKSRVVGISLKDRAAILPAGHMADGAYWFDAKTGNFVSSTYYFAELPKWAADLNASSPTAQFANKDWLGHKMPAGGVELYGAVDATPFGNELIQQCALAALKNEKLGMGDKIDLLAVSYSSNDYVGHRYGPDSNEVHDMALRVDKLIGDLIDAAEKQAGSGRVLVVLSADHGVSPVPEENWKHKMPGGRLNLQDERDGVEAALSNRFGQPSGAKWIADVAEGYYLNLDTVAARKANLPDVEQTAAGALREMPHVFRVYTRTQLLNGWIANDEVDLLVRNGFNAARSANITVLHDPYWISGGSGTTHSAPFDYDTHVPVLFWGTQVHAGRYVNSIAVNDVAPTLATMLDIETPSGSVGRALDEMLK